MSDLQSHWNKVYQNSETESLGWYENTPEPSLQLIEKCQLSRDASIFHAGAGTSKLIDHLLNEGFQQQIICDISSVAISKLQDRLGEKGRQLQWLLADLSNAGSLKDLPAVDLWHDRAVLHFFIEEQERINYFESIKKSVKRNGHVIIASFSLDGAKICSGLPVYRHNEESISAGLGCGFALEESFHYDYRMPSGAIRPYIYTLFKRFI